MAVNLADMGYRTKAQRIAELRMLAKNAGLTTTQRNKMETTLKNVCDDLMHCANARKAILDRVVTISMNERHAVMIRKEKSNKVKK